jgi:hypothetical protein
MSKKNAKEFPNPSRLFRSKRRGQGLFGLLVHIMYLNGGMNRLRSPYVTTYCYDRFLEILFFLKIFLD